MTLYKIRTFTVKGGPLERKNELNHTPVFPSSEKIMSPLIVNGVLIILLILSSILQCIGCNIPALTSLQPFQFGPLYEWERKRLNVEF